MFYNPTTALLSLLLKKGRSGCYVIVTQTSAQSSRSCQIMTQFFGRHKLSKTLKWLNTLHNFFLLEEKLHHINAYHNSILKTEGHKSKIKGVF